MQYQAVVRKFGPAQDVVELEQAALPPLRRDEVRVRLLARAINPSDIITISGAYSGRTTLPFIPGFETFGVIEQCGEEVHGLSPGTRVLPVRSAAGLAGIQGYRSRLVPACSGRAHRLRGCDELRQSDDGLVDAACQDRAEAGHAHRRQCRRLFDRSDIDRSRQRRRGGAGRHRAQRRIT